MFFFDKDDKVWENISLFGKNLVLILKIILIVKLTEIKKVF